MIGDTKFFDCQSVTYRVDPSDPAVAGFYGSGRVTIDHQGRKMEIVTSVDVESDAKDSPSASTGNFPKTAQSRAKSAGVEKFPAISSERRSPRRAADDHLGAIDIRVPRLKFGLQAHAQFRDVDQFPA